MSEDIQSKLKKIISPFVKNKERLENVTSETTFLNDLEVSSSRLVDIVLEIEDTFDIEVSDEEADKITSFGAAVELIQSKQEQGAG